MMSQEEEESLINKKQSLDKDSKEEYEKERAESRHQKKLRTGIIS